MQITIKNYVELEDKYVRCAKCGHKIGRVIEVIDPRNPQSEERISLLESGGIIHRYTTGYCAHCFEPFYWDVNERKLSRLLQGRSPL